MTKIIENEKLIYCDIDDTVILWDLSKYNNVLPESDLVTINSYGLESVVYKNQKNINLLHKLYKLNYGIILWSQTGAKHAAAVAEALGLDDIVLQYQTKPRYHIDDLPADAWMGTRLWRDPVTGEEE